MSLFFLAMTEQGSPVLWPAGDTHTVEYAELSPNVPEELAPLVPKLRRLAQLGDAMGSLQAADGSTADEDAAREIAAASARLLNEIADADEVTPETAETMRLRADALTNGTSREAVARREAALARPAAADRDLRADGHLAAEDADAAAQRRRRDPARGRRPADRRDRQPAPRRRWPPSARSSASRAST